jgi:hypothetical protein
MYLRLTVSLVSARQRPLLLQKGDVAMEVLLAVLQLLIVLLGVLKAYFELRGSGKEEDDHPDAHDDDHRPKHLREGR